MTWPGSRTGPTGSTVTRDEAVGGWTGWVDDLPVRHLFAGGRELTGLMVWSEVFARCDDPPAAVRWSDLLGARRAPAPTHRPDRLTVSYQAVTDGGCSNTDVRVAPDGRSVEQRTVDRPRTWRPARRVPFG